MAVSAAVNQELSVVSDASLVRDVLTRIREAHAEVSLDEYGDDNQEVVEHERRRAIRAKMQLPVTITPADWGIEDDDAVMICGDEQIGVTRDISPTGIGMTHDHLLGSEVAIVQFDLPGVAPLNMVVDLRWSVRQTKYCFMSGGRVIGLLEPVPEFEL